MNLIIGNTSQQSYYYPSNYTRISSRNIKKIKNNWDSVYITFAEQRVHDENIDFNIVNYNYTKNIINDLIIGSKRIIFYATCDLWNNCEGVVDINTPFNYTSNNGYIKSKHDMIDYIKNMRKKDERYKKIIIIYPFYFNSSYRKNYFLFGKIFESIIKKKKIEIGNTYFYRDMVHTKYMVDRVMHIKNDEIIGSGTLHNVNEYIRRLYSKFDMDYDEYVKEVGIDKKNNFKRIFYSKQEKIYTMDDLLFDSVCDINKKING